MTAQPQPEALRLADWIDSDFDPDDMHEFGYDQITAELRRLHAEVAQLREKRQPLSDEQIKAAFQAAREQLAFHEVIKTDQVMRRLFARAIERIQGIGDPA